MFLPCGGKDNNVVKIKEALFPVETREDAIHEAGEGSGSVAETKWDLVELVQLSTGNAVFSLSHSMIWTCQYPLFKSKVENQRAPCNASRRSSVRGRGCASLTVAALS